MYFTGPIKRRFLHITPYFLTMLIIPLSVIGSNKTLSDIIGGLNNTSIGFQEIPRTDYLFTQFRVIVTYLRLLVLPVNQNIDYDYPLLHSFFDIQVILSFAFIAFLIAVAIYLILQPKHFNPIIRLAGFGLLWFFITVSVESSVIPIPMLINEYRIYLPSVGFIISLISFTIYLFQRYRVNNKAALSILLSLSVILTAMTYNRNSVWKDGINLWSDTVEKSPRKARPYNNLGILYAERGDIATAVKYYRQALLLDPGSFETLVNLGNSYSDINKVDLAIEMYMAAIKIQPAHPGIYYNLGVVYERKGEYNTAGAAYRKALDLDPTYEYPKRRLAILNSRPNNSQ